MIQFFRKRRILEKCKAQRYERKIKALVLEINNPKQSQIETLAEKYSSKMLYELWKQSEDCESAAIYFSSNFCESTIFKLESKRNSIYFRDAWNLRTKRLEEGEKK